MKFRALDANGDWTFGNGVQNYLTNQDAVAIDIKTALQIFSGEVFWAVDFGVDWWNLIGSRDQVSILLQTRSIISSRDGVIRIKNVTAALNAARRLSLSYSVDTVFSRNINGSVQVP